MERLGKSKFFRFVTMVLVLAMILGTSSQSALASTQSFGQNSNYLQTNYLPDSKVLEDAESIDVSNEYIIKYKESAVKNETKKEQILESTEENFSDWGVSVEDEGNKDIALISADQNLTPKEEENLIESLQEDKNITHVEKNHEVKAFGTQDVKPLALTEAGEQQWGTDAIRAQQAWDMIPEETSKVRVAVVDTGIDPTHPDLEGRVIDGTTVIEYTSSGSKYSDDGRDDHGHGTHVAGIIGAVWNNSKGIDGVVGKIDIEILPVKVLNNAGQGSKYDIINGITYAADHGSSIINLSLGSNYSSELEAEAIRYAQNKGCLVVAAAGNDGFNVSMTYPASYDNVLSVGATDSANQRAYFSNYGETLDLAAPGSEIISSVPKRIALQEKAAGEPIYGDDDEGYFVSWSGTSMACPHVVGVAALYKAINPKSEGFDIGNHLINTAQDVGDIGKDIETGAGVVDAAAALGEDIIKTPLLIKSPKAGTELYETVNLTAQVNTTMEIKNLKFYLDFQESGNEIASIPCNPENAFYQYEWDTNKVSDGDHDILAAVFNENGDQVGETKNVSINILNTITNGFTLQIKDPDGKGADNASYLIYGKKDDGSYKYLKRGNSTDLGFARVKGLDKDLSEYKIFVTGSFNNNGGVKQYLYQRDFTNDRLGEKISIRGENAKEVTVDAITENESDIKSAYLKLEPAYKVNEQTQYFDMISPWSIVLGETIFVDSGEYKGQLYSAPSSFNSSAQGQTAYYLVDNFDIQDINSSMNFDYKDSTEVVPEFPVRVTGKIMLEQINGESTIPFISGNISGSKIYITPGSKYKVYANMREELSTSDKMLKMERPSPLQVEEKQVIVPFDTNIQVTKFEPKSGIKKDNDIYYMNVGGTMSTENIFEDINGSKIADSGNTAPTFSLYKIVDGEKTLVYERTDSWQAKSSYWNSKTDFIGTKPPTSGDYVAELTFDAGVFGGKSHKEFDFEIRTKSGQEEMTSKITMGNYTMANSKMDIFSWSNDDGGKWQKTNTKALKSADDSGIIREIVVDNIALNPEGINLAVINFNGRKQGYNPGEYYKGFAVVPFETFEDIENIQLKENDLVQMSTKITDVSGNSKSAPLYVSLNSDCNGKLADQKPVADIKIQIGNTNHDQKYNIPKGSYNYMYSVFNDSSASYMLKADAFTASEGQKVDLDASEANLLTVDVPSKYIGNKVIPTFANQNSEGSSMSLEVSNKMYFTPGKYSMRAQMYTLGRQYELNLSSQNEIDLTSDTSWNIGENFDLNVKLNQRIVSSNQDLLGEIKFNDGKGNNLTSVRQKQSGLFTEIYPEITIGSDMTSENEHSIQLSGSSAYSSFSIPSANYFGEGSHYLKFKYDIGQGVKETQKYTFAVGDESEAKIIPDDNPNYSFESKQDGSCVLTMNEEVRGFTPITVNVGAALIKRDVTFIHIRDGKVIKSINVGDVFTKNNNKVTVKLNLKPGDKIEVKAY